MTLPDSNISIMDVRNVLGYPSTDLGTLCSCPNINPWSKKKPVWLSPEALKYVLNGGRLKDYPEWWKGATGNFGFTFPLNNDYKSIVNGANWEYSPPTGGSTQPYILGSFAEYNHDAPPFLATTVKKSNNEITVNRTIQSRYGAGALISLGSDTTIGFDDLAESRLGNTYFSLIMFYDDNTTNPTYLSADTTLSDGGSVVWIDLNSSPFLIDRTWTCYYALRTTQSSAAFYPIPWDDDHYYMFKLKIISESPFKITCEKFSGTYNGVYSNISDFAFSSIDPSQTKYYPTKGPLYFKLEMSTKSATEIAMSRFNLSLETISYHGTNESMTPVMYSSSFSAIDTAYINQNSTTVVYIGSQYALSSKNGSATVPTSGKKIYTLVKIKYKDEVIFSTGLNVVAN